MTIINEKRRSNFKDITGQKIGKLTVVQCIGTKQKKSGKSSIWECKCDCGKITNITKDNLNNAKSCGCLRGAKNKDFNEHVINHILNGYKQKSRVRNLEFKLTKEEFLKLILDNCYYCNQKELSKTFYKKKNGELTGFLKHNGIDRKDNNLGYTLQNSLPCCKICNRAKNSMTYEEFIEYLNNLTNYRINNGTF